MAVAAAMDMYSVNNTQVGLKAAFTAMRRPDKPAPTGDRVLPDAYTKALIADTDVWWSTFLFGHKFTATR
ncbi:hypothetical protein [Pseudomonas izuensis]|uniref:hypothetical protein n=1 Tax=Pseudomonas izuensis TaxID=2684212 RepID=UPI001358CC34|nr:hypothetical protein [Pseudomonas izuensis]